MITFNENNIIQKSFNFFELEILQVNMFASCHDLRDLSAHQYPLENKQLIKMR